MAVNVGQAVGYLDLDTTKFKAGFTSALSTLKVFQDKSATTSDKIGGVGKAAGMAGRSLTKGLTVPLTLFGGAALKVTSNFESQMSKVKAISGATGSDMDKLKSKAIEMGAKTKFSATESGQAFEYMAMAGWKTSEMLDGIEGIMNLAAASGEDLATTSDIVTDALTAFGYKAKDAGHFADILAKASSNSNTNVSLMGETFKYVAPVAGALGYKAEDVAVAVGLMANAGIKGSQAGTALRTMMSRLAKPTNEVQGAMDKLGISMTDSNGKVKPLRDLMGDLREKFNGLSKAQKAQYASTLAGQEGMSGMLAIVNASEKDYKKLIRAIDNCDGAARKMAAEMVNNLKGSLILAKSAMEGLGIKIGVILLPRMKALVDKFTAFVAWLSTTSDRTLRLIVNFATFLAAIGPVLLIVSKLIAAYQKLSRVYSVLSKVLKSEAIAGFIKSAAAKMKDVAATIASTAANMANAVSQSAVGRSAGSAVGRVLALASAHKVAAYAALGVVGAVAGVALYMYKTGTSFSDLGNKLGNFVTSFINRLPLLVSQIGVFISNFAAQIPTMARSLGSALGDIITKAAKWWANDMPKLIKVGGDMIVKLIEGITGKMPALVNYATTAIVRWADAVSSKLPTIINSGANMMTKFITGLSNKIPEIINAAVKIITTLLQGLANNLPKMAKASVKIIVAIVTGLIKALPQIIAASVKIMIALAKGIIQSLPTILKGIAQIALAIVKGLIKAIPAIIGAGVKLFVALVKAIPKVLGAIGGGIAHLTSYIRSKISSGLSGAWGGLKSGLHSALSGAHQVASSTLSKMQASFQSHGGGIRGAWAATLTGVNSIAHSSFNGLNAITGGRLGAVVNTAHGMFGALREKVGGAFTAIKGTFNSFRPHWPTIGGNLVGAVTSVRNRVSSVLSAIRGFFHNLKLRIPSPHLPKLPHFSLKTSTTSIMGKSITYPTGFGISWYAKGGIFNRPTIFNTPYGMKGVGEAGAEAVVPLSQLWNRLDKLIQHVGAMAESVKFAVLAMENSFPSDILGELSKVAKTEDFPANKPRQGGGDTYNFYSPKALTAEESARQMKKAKRDLILGY